MTASARTIKLAALLVIAVGAMVLVVWYSMPTDSHHSLRYMLWKRGLISYQDGFLRALKSDPNRETFLGVTREVMEERFGGLEQLPVPSIERYRTRTAGWVLTFDGNGRLISLDLPKG